MLGFKNFYAAQKILAGVELVRMLKKGQMRKVVMFYRQQINSML